MNFGLPLLLGLGERRYRRRRSYWPAYCGWSSVTTLTFFINSLAHMWGVQPYTDENTARDNWVVALLTYGEGYHNFHHMFAHDYRNGVRWWQWDPSKWFIYAHALGWAGQQSQARTLVQDPTRSAR